MHALRTLVATAVVLGLLGLNVRAEDGSPTSGRASLASDYADLSLEALMDIPVTLVSKKETRYDQTPGAISVLTQEDIRRSGVTNIPDALRLVPGLQVARVDASDWAVSSRGLADLYANKLLVMIDGRSVYTPTFSGVFWNSRDVMLEDLDRIEIVRGPGAAMWGANAVNGVINIITKNARETQGGLVSLGIGNEERGFGSFRYGGRLAESTFFRVYGKYFDRDASEFIGGGDARDEWRMGQGGFRVDWEPDDSIVATLQGDTYRGRQRETTTDALPAPPYSVTLNRPIDLYGGNVLGRWARTFSEESHLQLQAYYDQVHRDHPRTEEGRKTADIELQHRLLLGERNDLIWGLGYRHSRDDLSGSFSTSYEPSRRSLDLLSVFAQDEIVLVENRLSLHLGARLEHNDFNGFEFQPNVRLLWTPHERHTVWATASRAVRTPSRTDADLRFHQSSDLPGVLIRVSGNRGFKAEELWAYEAGYRVQPNERISLDTAVFYHAYHRLRSGEFAGLTPGVPAFIDVMIDNGDSGETYGVEFSPRFQLASWWDLRMGYSFLHDQIHPSPTSLIVGSPGSDGASPQQQFFVHSSFDLGSNVELDVMGRYVDQLPALSVGDYVALDMRLAWRPRRDLELSLVGQNLLDPVHPEFSSSFLSEQRIEVERSLYAKLTWSF